MSGADPGDVRRVFAEASEVQGEARRRLLEERCAGDAALRSRVEALLRAVETAGDFLQGPTIGAAGAALPGQDEPSEPAGTVIGPYVLGELLGRGGFGEVYAAEQQHPIRRAVALKIVRRGMDTRAVIRRFESERQALAVMSHPNIASVYDAGSTGTGRPYFAMELVPGEPITRYCDRLRLSIAERLGVFLQLCRAVQHAHQKGVIHRDLKPSNVLVRTGDDGGHVVKVIDFGIAKAIDVRGAERQAFTEQRQLVGTPEYMSPEQAEGAADIDTRSDVYALGVVLYELLAGVTPLDGQELRSAAFAEMQRLIREREPQTPSDRLSRLGDVLAGVAATRQVDPARLPALVRGELDWIVMRTLEKERARRYDSAGGLATDVERYLAHEPVEAAPPSAAYRLRKLIRRHRVAVAIGSVAAAALVVGAVGITLGLVQARAALAQTRVERERSAAIAAFMDDAFRGITPAVARGRDGTLLREMMQAAVVRLDAGQLAANPAAEAELRLTIGEVLSSLAEHRAARAQRELARTRAIEAAGEGSALARRATLALADSLTEMQEAPAAITAIDAVLSSGDVGDLGSAARVLRSRAVYLERGGWTPQAEADARAGLGLAVAQHGEGGAATLPALTNLARLLSAGNQPAEAERLMGRAVELSTRSLGASHPETLERRGMLAEQLVQQERLDEAEAALAELVDETTRVYGSEHPALADVLVRRAMLRRAREKPAEALADDERALAIRRRTLGATHRDVATSLVSVARSRAGSGDCAGAEGPAREALAIREALAGPNSAVYASSLTDLGRIELCLGRLGEARRTLERAAATWAQAEPRGSHRLEAVTDLADAMQQQGEDLAAAELYEQTLDLNLSELPQHRFALAYNLSELSTVLAQRGEPGAASRFAQRALAVVREQGTADGWEVARVLGNVASVVAMNNRLDDAAALARERLAMARRIDPTGRGGQVVRAMETLGQIHLARGEDDEAIVTLRDAMALELEADIMSPRAAWYNGLAAMAVISRAKARGEPQATWDEARRDLAAAYTRLTAPELRSDWLVQMWAGRVARALAEWHEAMATREPAGGHEAQAAEWRQRAAAASR